MSTDAIDEALTTRAIILAKELLREDRAMIACEIPIGEEDGEYVSVKVSRRNPDLPDNERLETWIRGSERYRSVTPDGAYLASYAKRPNSLQE